MPKIEGRASTRKTTKIAGLEMASFLMYHEDRYHKRTCAIEGCDHKIGPTMQMLRDGWEPCSKDALPGFAARKKGNEYVNVGVVCACHAAEILRGA